MANGSLLFTASCKNAHLLADWPQKIQKIFVANQEPALARPFGSGPYELVPWGSFVLRCPPYRGVRPIEVSAF